MSGSTGPRDPRARRKLYQQREIAGRKIQYDPRPCPAEKITYKTKQIAQNAAGNCGIPLYHYKCPHCGKFHLTKQEQK